MSERYSRPLTEEEGPNVHVWTSILNEVDMPQPLETTNEPPLSGQDTASEIAAAQELVEQAYEAAEGENNAN